MKIHYLRNNTYIINDDDCRYLVNPVLGELDTVLPLPTKDIIKGIEAVILTKVDKDFFDDVAQNLLQKNIKILIPNDIDKKSIMDLKFKNVEYLDEKLSSYIDEYNKLNYKPTNGEILLFDSMLG